MKHLACIAMLLLFAATSQTLAGEDTELWSTVELQYEVSKKVSLAGSGSFRLEEDASTRKSLLGDFKVDYELTKILDLGVGIRHVLLPNNRWNKWALTVDVNPSYEIDDVDISFRLRWRRYFANGQEEAETTIRPRLRLRLESKKDFRPWVFIEGIYLETELRERWDALRTALGFDYRFSGATTFSWSLFFEKELNRNYPDVREVFRFELIQEL